MTNSSVYVVDALRTPVGKYGGTLASVRPDDMAAFVIKSLIERNAGIDVSAVDEVIFGAANQAGEDNRNVARMASLLAGLPIEVPGYTINRLCASGLQSYMNALMAIGSGNAEMIIAGGTESMSRAPFVMAKSETAYNRVPDIYDTTIGWRFTNDKLAEMYFPYAMGETAENVAEKWGITRLEQDEFAFNSQSKYQAAHEAGKFSDELVSYTIPLRKKDPLIFDKDEHPRLSSVEVLGGLRAAFREGGSVTAGNSSGVNDGAATALIVSEEALKKYNLTPMARIVSIGAAGVDPACMGIGPVPATRKALKKAGLSTKDLGLVELNEAFASQSIACMRELDLNPNIVNVNGGSIAIGHPLGASGARISATLLNEMQKRPDVKYGLATMCIGVGQGCAVLFENCK
jgi:acetyl-CoA C-acetyltransferase